MGLKYYRRSHPTSKLFTDSGAHVQFTSLDGNVTGYFATDVEPLQSELATMIREGRGGMTEIDAATFQRDYVDKKKAGIALPKVWREEFSNGQVKPSESTLKDRLETVAKSVAVVNPEPPAAVAATVAEVNQVIAAKLPTAQTFAPPVGKRTPKPAKTKPA